jgi:hypothetical protein
MFKNSSSVFDGSSLGIQKAFPARRITYQKNLLSLQKLSNPPFFTGKRNHPVPFFLSDVSTIRNFEHVYEPVLRLDLIIRDMAELNDDRENQASRKIEACATVLKTVVK